MSEEGFLSRWSRRKRAAEAGRPAEEPVAAEAAPAAPVPPDPVPEEEPPFDITTLPPVESLTIESDFAAFLRKEVPEALKRAALRKAWSLDPAIRDFIGPADYAWDYNAPDGVPGASLDLGGNVKEMLARIFSAAEGSPVAAPAAAEPDAQPPAPPVEEAPRPTPIAVAEMPPPKGADAPAPAPAMRRHGSALPG